MLKNEKQMSVHLSNALGHLKDVIQQLATLAEEQVANAMVALLENNTSLARQIIERDEALDRMEVEVEEECLKTLALYQPVAHDLRFVVSALKLANGLERIGDYGSHIAERTISLSGRVDPNSLLPLEEMGKKVMVMLRNSIEALINQDSGLARRVWDLDREIDLFHKENFIRMEAHIKESPLRVGFLMQLISVSRYLERVADIATNISEDVVYLVEGKVLRHHHHQPANNE